MSKITEPFPIFYDDDGTPLDNGMIYVGEANQNPRENPIQVYYDAAFTLLASQPIRTLGGRPAYQGAPVSLYVDASTYSIEVQNRFGTPITGPVTVPADSDIISGANVTFVQSGTGAEERTAQAKLRERVSPEDFGAIGDGNLHPLSERYTTLAAAQAVYPFATALTQQIDYCAIVAAINSRIFTSHGLFYHSGPEVWLRDGAVYRMGSDTLQLKRSVRICGAGSGMAWTSMAAMRWDAGATGIIVHRFNTIGNGIESPATTGADGSVLEGFRMIGAYGTADAFGGHGIRLRARAIIRDVYIENFTGDNVHIVATAGGSASEEGNANSYQIHGGRFQFAGGNGIYVAGADANAGTCVGSDVSFNRLWGIRDSSFLGNTWVSCHADSNGVELSGATPVKSAYASRSGTTYHAVPGATEAQLRTTEPGTNRNIWRACNATSYAIAWTGSNPTGTYRQGGGYHSDNANARCAFEGCYNEGGQGLVWGSQHTLFVGGSLTETPVTSGAAIEGRFNNTWTRQGFVSESLSNANKAVEAAVGGNGENGDVLRFSYSDDTTGKTWRLRRSGADYVVDNENSGSRIAFTLTGQSTARQFGTGAAIPYLFAVSRLGLGDGADARRITYGSAAPTTGAWAQGDIVFNIGAAAGGKVGFVCTAAGTPGTWKPFGGIDP